MVGVVVVGDGSGSGGATTVDVAERESAPTPAAASTPAEPAGQPLAAADQPGDREDRRAREPEGRQTPGGY
jgi:hypothetical protein